MATATRPQTFARETFETFAISESTLNPGALLPLDDAEDLASAVEAAALRVPHKGKFMVRHTNVLTGAVVLRFYAVKRKSVPDYRYHDFQTRAVRDTYADPLFDVDGVALAACVAAGL